MILYLNPALLTQTVLGIMILYLNPPLLTQTVLGNNDTVS